MEQIALRDEGQEYIHLIVGSLPAQSRAATTGWQLVLAAVVRPAWQMLSRFAYLMFGYHDGLGRISGRIAPETAHLLADDLSISVAGPVMIDRTTPHRQEMWRGSRAPR